MKSIPHPMVHILYGTLSSAKNTNLTILAYLSIDVVYIYIHCYVCLCIYLYIKFLCKVVFVYWFSPYMYVFVTTDITDYGQLEFSCLHTRGNHLTFNIIVALMIFSLCNIRVILHNNNNNKKKKKKLKLHVGSKHN